MCVMKSVEV
uniref:Uncharacterized protein n=1 Tax=Rhizophora mucronata TaxID=61149 RepID=A0A2P2QQ56_RHIMU